MQISEVWIWASSFLLLLKLSYCCIANHPKCNGLKKKLFIFCHYFVGLPDGSSALLTCVLLCSCFWLFGWPLPKGQNGFPPTSRTLVLTGRGDLSVCRVIPWQSGLFHADARQKQKLQCFLLGMCCKFHNVPPTTLLVKSSHKANRDSKKRKIDYVLTGVARSQCKKPCGMGGLLCHLINVHHIGSSAP